MLDEKSREYVYFLCQTKYSVRIEASMTIGLARGTGGRVVRRSLGFGPWAVFLLSVAGMYALATVLLGSLGEFWSMAAFLPLWVILYLLVHLGQVFLEACHDRA
jgi:hypothetical protein